MFRESTLLPNQTQQAEMFSARQVVRTTLAKSQAKEHAYFSAAAEAIGKHMKALCAAWSMLLNDHVLNGSATGIKRFSGATGIALERLEAWRHANRAVASAEAELTAAKDELTAAEATRSKYAGKLWGAKKGCEQEYAHRDLIVKKAKANVVHERATLVKTEEVLDHLSESLLRDCIGRSAMVSNSIEFGSDVARILLSMQMEAQAMEHKHKAEQFALIETAGQAFVALAENYRKS